MSYKDSLKIVQELRGEIAELKAPAKELIELSRMTNIELINECKRLSGIIRDKNKSIDSMVDYKRENEELKRVISRKNQKIQRQKDKIKGWMDKLK